VVRDRGLSNARESVMQADWFLSEAHARTQHCDFPILVTTANDGDNGGSFRRTRQQLLNCLLHRANRPDTRRSGRRGAADLRAEMSRTGQRRGSTAATRTSTSPLSTSSRRPASSPDVPDRPTDIERRTAHALKASEAKLKVREAKLKVREANLARTQRHGEARPRRDRPARL
jgi:hypothetical protein